MTAPAPARLTVLVAFTGDGGVEKMITNLLHGFVEAGVAVDLLLLKSRGSHVRSIPPGVNVVPMNARTSLFALPALIRYLRREQPDVMLVAKDRASRVALVARRLAGARTRIVLRMGMHLSGSLAGKSALRRWGRFLPVRWLYPRADRIITVAQAVADDLAGIGGIPRERFTVIPNPSIPVDLEDRAREPVAHPWLREGETTPVVLGVGRLKAQKGFDILIRAFARAHGERPMRLILLGEGPERRHLEALADDLGVAGDVDLPGFAVNPYAWMARADLFVLSSRFEGSPNALVEAMAVGTRVVATDCPSGPAEILRGGTVAPLVATEDVAGLARAMIEALDHPPDPRALGEAVASYRLEASTRHYLEALGIAPTSDLPDHRVAAEQEGRE